LDLIQLAWQELSCEDKCSSLSFWLCLVAA